MKPKLQLNYIVITTYPQYLPIIYPNAEALEEKLQQNATFIRLLITILH